MTATLTVRPVAACATRLDIDWLSRGRLEQARAVAVCHTCPIEAACRDEALRTRRFDTVRGGCTPAQLRALAPGVVRPAVVRHGKRSTYNAGCHCRRCSVANARYVARWRATRAVTSGPKLLVAVLTKPSGRGRGRAYEGQTFIEIGVGK